MQAPTVIPLRVSAQTATPGTTTGTGVAQRDSIKGGTAVLDISAIGLLVQATDTLDVYVDASHDGTTFFNIGRFLRIAGVSSVAATGTLTSTGAITSAVHAQSTLTSDASNVNDDIAATQTLTSDNVNVSDGEQVVIGVKTYTFKTALTPTEGEVLIGLDADASLLNLINAINHTGTPGTDYSCAAANTQVTAASSVTTHTFAVTAIVAGAAGNSIASTESSAHLSWGATTLTGGADAETVTIGSTVYRFKNTMAQAYDVKIGVDAATSLANLKKAINASGTAGVEYFAGTLIHPTVTGHTIGATTLLCVARAGGTAANTIATTETSVHLSWTGTTLNAGTAGVAGETVTIGSKTYTFVATLTESYGNATAVVNEVLYGSSVTTAFANLRKAINHSATEGTDYSTGTTANADATSGASDATTVSLTAVTIGTPGNSVATTETMANGAFGATTLTGGTYGPGVLARQALTWSASAVETSQPVDIESDISSTSGGIRQVGIGQVLRYRGVVSGATADFTYSVYFVGKQ